MSARLSILCPVDFSKPSAGALRYAAAIAAHFQAELMVLTVENPLLTEARDLGMGVVYAAEDSLRQLVEFANSALEGCDCAGVTPTYDVAVGKAAEVVLRAAHERGCDLIVVSTHGLTGIRKLVFGSTTERILRATTVPVLVTPGDDAGPARLEDIAGTVGRILVPVDLESDASRQLAVAAGIGRALGVSMDIAHVIAPVRAPFYARQAVDALESARGSRADDLLRRMVPSVTEVRCDVLVVPGEPSEEIARLARDRRAGLIVVGLHASPLFGPRMGSVTYRTLCQTQSLVLAIPPVGSASHRAETTGAAGRAAAARGEGTDDESAGVYATVA